MTKRERKRRGLGGWWTEAGSNFEVLFTSAVRDAVGRAVVTGALYLISDTAV